MNASLLCAKISPVFPHSAKTREEALAESQIAVDLFIETYRSKGIKLPQPRSAILVTV